MRTNPLDSHDSCNLNSVAPFINTVDTGEVTASNIYDKALISEKMESFPWTMRYVSPLFSVPDNSINEKLLMDSNSDCGGRAYIFLCLGACFPTFSFTFLSQCLPTKKDTALPNCFNVQGMVIVLWHLLGVNILLATQGKEKEQCRDRPNDSHRVGCCFVLFIL